ncbi:MAG TPA: trypsin-like peptidase domain-containing protein [Candidatus Baltobacteraceae bacterium]|jgi:S1-C subfamily serine protease
MKSNVVLVAILAGVIGGVSGTLATLNLAPHRVLADNLDDQQRIIDAVKHSEPSVVALNVTANGTRIAPTNPLGLLFGAPSGERVVPFHEVASGSGFVFDKDGLILTDDHVVHGAQKITVVFQNGDKIPGKIFGEDYNDDIALVKVENYAKLPPPLELGDSATVQKGEWTIAIGEPLELSQTVTVGVASAFGRDEQIEGEDGVQRTFRNLLQTSAPINPGNSGGPLIDLDGRVIAINQSVAAPAQGIGFAVPASVIETSVASIQAHPGVMNTAPVGFLGVQLVAIDDNVRKVLHYKGSGAVILGAISGSPAASAGLHPGDVIQAVNGKNVNGAQQVTKIVGALKPGEIAKVRIWRKGKTKTVNVRLGTRPLG